MEEQATIIYVLKGLHTELILSILFIPGLQLCHFRLNLKKKSISQIQTRPHRGHIGEIYSYTQLHIPSLLGIKLKSHHWITIYYEIFSSFSISVSQFESNTFFLERLHIMLPSTL